MSLVGPIFTREAITAPRHLSHFIIRTGYVAGLFVLLYTLQQVTFGWQQQRNLGDLARFGSLAFQALALIQLALMMFFALLFAAGNVAQEKDRKTLILLLMTDLTDRELVLGKLASSLLIVAVVLAAGLPVFAFLHLLGGTTLPQIGMAALLTASAGLAAGSWGSFVGFWREKTFQTLAWSVLGLVLFLGLIEGVVLLGGERAAAITLLDPFRGLLVVLDNLGAAARRGGLTGQPWNYVLAQLGLAAALNAGAVAGLRWWNPSDAHVRTRPDDESGPRRRTRSVWENPVIWREICTRAYGRRVFVIKLAYLLLFAATAWTIYGEPLETEAAVLGLVSGGGAAFIGLAILGLMLINAQAVTAITSERDGKTLELLLVTDVTAPEFIYGKLFGVFVNAGELIALPCLLAIAFLVRGDLTAETLFYVAAGYLVLVLFSATLGIHCGLSFDSSRSAIANSLGTMFFLFLGIFICMMLILEARSSFWLQLPSFLVFILGGSLALSVSLTNKNPSPALTLCAFALPFLTFYAITGFMLRETLGVWLSVVITYGFTSAAMLVPAVSEFDVALGRTTIDAG